MKAGQLSLTKREANVSCEALLISKNPHREKENDH